MENGTTLGQIVRERRAALGYTQVEVAQRVGCATITIRKIEADALRPSVQMAKLIALALEIPEAEQSAFIHLARSEPQPGRTPVPSPSPGTIGEKDLAGRTIRGFQLGKRIGSGGVGVVYRATQPAVDREVAVKVILPRYANNPNFIRRFEAEAQIIARLEHPHIVPLYDYWREPDAAYLIMRLLRGGSLEDQLTQGPIPIAQVQQIIQQIGTALEMAHRQGIVHRDIKPANILIDEENNAYLADFGIAEDVEKVSHTSVPEGGILIGSPAYISPEQILDEPVSPRSDIYCLGILLYEVLTGYKPFLADTPLGYLQKHLNESLPPLQKYKPELPVALDAVIQQATAKKSEGRYPNVRAFLDALQNVLVVEKGVMVDVPAVSAPVVETNTQAFADVENPYMGLRAFDEADALYFHGRGASIQEIISNLSAPSELARFLVVVGPSGSGKSSVVKAGLLPALRRGGLPGSENWFMLDITPGPHPWEELEAAFLRVAVNPPATLLEQLQDGERGLIRAVQRILPIDPEIELLLVIDQFEELFTLVEDEEVREQFLNSLVTAVLDPRSRLRVIITLRADFYDRPLQYMDFGDLLRQRTVTILPMMPDELEQAIVQPASQVGVQFESGLVAAMLGEVGQQPGSLPLLQYALTELFTKRQNNRMTRAAYEAAGGVTGALARRADELFESLSSAGQEMARQLFLRLVTLGEGVEDTRRRVLQVELSDLTISGLADAASLLDQVLEVYGRYRLLTFDHDPATRLPTVEVAHEALLREWDRLGDWVAESRADIRLQRLLSAATREWITADRDEGFLLHGARLGQYESWFSSTRVALTQDEYAFLTNSIAARQLQQAEEQARQARELETTRQLAETESQRAQEQAEAAKTLKRRAIYLAIALGVAMILAITAGIFGNQSNKNAKLAATREAVAQDNLLEAEQQRLAAQALSSEDPELSALLALRSLQFGYSEEADLALVSALESGFSEYTFKEHFGRIRNIEISPNGQYLASTGGFDQMVLVWDLHTYELVHRFNLVNIAQDIIFTPDNRSLIMSDYEGHIDMANLETGEISQLFQIPGNYQDIYLEISLRGNLLLASSHRVAFLFDLESGERIQRFFHGSEILGVALTPDDRFAFTGGTDGKVRMWDVATENEVRQFIGHQAAVHSLDLSPDGKSLLTSSIDGYAHLWNVETGEVKHSFMIGPARQVGINDYVWREPFLEARFSSDGKWIAISTTDGQLQVRDSQSGQLFYVWSGIGGQAITWSPDGTHIAASTSNFEVNYWAIPRPQYPLLLSQHPGGVASLAFSREGDKLISGGKEDVQRWDAESGRLLGYYLSPYVLNSTFDALTSVVLDEEEGRILGLTGMGNIFAWDISTSLYEKIHFYDGVPAVKNSGLSSNGRFILVRPAFISKTWGWLMDVETGTLLQKFSTPDQYTSGAELIQTLVFGERVSPDGRWVVQFDNQDVNLLNIWDAETGQLAHTFAGHTNQILAIDFSADSQFLLTASADGTVRVWELASGEEIQRFVLTNVQILAAAFSPDGQFILMGGNDGLARLWELTTGKQIRVFGGHHQGGVTAVAFAPDGLRVATGDSAGDIRIWDIDLDSTIRLACAQLPRDFTDLERELYGILENTVTCPSSK